MENKKLRKERNREKCAGIRWGGNTDGKKDCENA